MVANETLVRILSHVEKLMRHATKFVTRNAKSLVLLSIPIAISVFLLVVWNRIRRKSRSTKVMELNCWFCNTDNMVNVKEKEEWYCKKCDQYNGFTRSGDYNKEIAEMYAKCAESSLPKHGNQRLDSNSVTSGYKLCDACNKMQILKVKQLAAFIPRNETFYEYEVEEYKHQLERRYKLCNACSRSLKRYLDDQDMQIKDTYGKDIAQYHQISDEDEREDRKKTLNKQRKKRKRTFINLSFLWPSSLLGLISLACAIFLCLTWLSGHFKVKLSSLAYTGCIARFFLWLLNPLSKRKLLYLLIWTFLSALLAAPAILKLKLMAPLIIFLLIIELWNSMWTGVIIATTFNTFARLMKRKDSLSKLKKLPKKRSPKVQKELKKEIKNQLVVVHQQKPNQDNIDGRIDVLSLGLTDSEDDTKQGSRVKVSKSWYASACRFVGEAEDNDIQNEGSKNGEQGFQLYPSKLLSSSVNKTKTNKSNPLKKESSQYKTDHLNRESGQRSANLPQQRIKQQLQEDSDVLDHTKKKIKGSQKSQSSKCTLMKYFCMGLLAITLFCSIALNVYLLKRDRRLSFS
ncbi:transmembrane protein 201 homolog isoform X2 [Rhopilema esculentum]|uniref:transmembrane protein 201 homolog isoform X2 n=1 Tax=Rhopilema esculentum TaxID=499914 RepID=UPI0031E1692A